MNVSGKLVFSMLIPLAFCHSLAQKPVAQKFILADFITDQRKTLFGDSPVMYLDGQKVVAKTNSLAGFNRKIVTFGYLNAVVPTMMVQIDDSFSQKPDLYDGLDERSKVLYFVSTLSENQVKIASSSSGIGLGDLDKQQQLVLNSIIPKKLGIERQEADKKDKRVVDKFTLSDTQRTKVRLKLSKSVYFELPLVSQPNSFCPTSSMGHTSLGETSGFFHVMEDEESGADEIFGVKVRSIVANKLKKSDINYSDSRLSSEIRFESPLTLLEVFAEVKKRTGFSIYADPRVAKRKLTLVGQAVKVGELLPAIAQSVTGTYRQVGPDFVLTSDIMGLGTRKLKFDQWEADVRDYINRMTKTWYKQIGTNGSLKHAKVSSSDPFQPSPKFDEYLAKIDQDHGRTPLTDDLIDSGVQGIVKRFNEMYKSQEVSTKGIVARNSLQYNLMMPTGQDILDPSKGDLGTFSMVYQEQRPSPFSQPPINVKKWKLKSDSTAGIVVRSQKKAEIESILPLAKSFGLKEVWIDTESSEALTTAINLSKNLGIRVRLAIRPWLNSDPNIESDRTLLGDTGNALHKWIPKNERLTPPIMGYDVSRAKLMPEDSVSPDTVPDRWQRIKSLLQVNGLQGVAVLDAQPSGYEPKVGLGVSYLTGPSDLAPRAFGYSTSMRSKFLRMHGVDPIDLVPKDLNSSVNTNPYFFQDMSLMGFPRTYGSLNGEEFIIEPYVDLWTKFRANAMTSGLDNLTSKLLKSARVPIWSDLLVGSTNKAMATYVPMFDISKLDEFQFDQSGPGVPYGAQAANALATRIVVDGDQNMLINQMLGSFTSPQFPSKGMCMCFDLSRLSEEEIGKFLTKWLEPQK